MVIDHSVIADVFGTPEAFERNVEIEYERNRERYQFLRWGQGAFDDFKVVPPGTGIVHQVNIEHLARTVFTREIDGRAATVAYPDTCVGTDSHTTMVNGIGVVGWGVGGIEAEAAMLGQPVSMLIPRVVGFKLNGDLPEGATATDLVLTITEMLRKHGVVGKFVEFYGPGVSALPLANRATIGNMCPEFGSTIAVFPIDEETTKYLELTGRSEEQLALVEAYAKEQGLWHDPDAEPRFSEKLELDLADRRTVAGRPEAPAGPRLAVRRQGVLPRRAGRLRRRPPASRTGTTRRSPSPSRPRTRRRHERQRLRPPHELRLRRARRTAAARATRRRSTLEDGTKFELDHGAVAIAAITSCTNTSNPSVMIGAALLAKKAVEKGLHQQAVGQDHAGARAPRSSPTTTSAPASRRTSTSSASTSSATAAPPASATPARSSPRSARPSTTTTSSVVSVLSGNRNFEGRINPDVKMNYLASPPLVVAYALAGSMDLDLFNDPLGQDTDGNDVFMKDIWPTAAEVEEVIAQRDHLRHVHRRLRRRVRRRRALAEPRDARRVTRSPGTRSRRTSASRRTSTACPRSPTAVEDIEGARVLAKLGDSVTTDHISPAGAIKKDSPAGKYLAEHGVENRDFNSYGSRRGNHEVMIRGTFANIRLRNQLAPGTEGGFTVDFTAGRQAGDDDLRGLREVPRRRARRW